MKHNFYGTHILGEAYDIPLSLFNNTEEIIIMLEKSIEQAGATLVQTICIPFTPCGFTIVSVLKESHVSIHAYPENRSIFVDVFTCGNKVNTEHIIINIFKYFQSNKNKIQTINRGIIDISF